MIGLFRRRAATSLRGVTFSERYSEVCTTECRSAARMDRTRTQALSYVMSVR